MSVLRRRMMQAQPRLGYVQDGLVLHLDSQFRGEHVWPDLSGKGNHAVKNEGGVFLLPAGFAPFAQFDALELEHCCFYSAEAAGTVFTTAVDGIRTRSYLAGGSRLWTTLNWTPTKEVSTPVTPGRSHAFSLRVTSATAFALFLNGQKSAENTSGDPIYKNENQLALNSSSFYHVNAPGTIDIHTFRLYNRALTEEEIAHNYAVDKARFGL